MAHLEPVHFSYAANGQNGVPKTHSPPSMRQFRPLSCLFPMQNKMRRRCAESACMAQHHTHNLLPSKYLFNFLLTNAARTRGACFGFCKRNK